jgi:hypothetical protein
MDQISLNKSEITNNKIDANIKKQIEFTLDENTDIAKRIDILKMLHKKAEEKVIHADKFRQTNMNYALVIFAG